MVLIDLSKAGISKNKETSRNYVEIILGYKDNQSFIDSFRSSASRLFNNKDKFGVYVKMWDMFKNKVDSFVYDELSEMLFEATESELMRMDKLLTEGNFMTTIPSEAIVPLTQIGIELNDSKQFAKLKAGIEEYPMLASYIAQAWAIAEKNTRGNGSNYLPEFYAGLIEVVDKGPEHIRKWAQTIVDDFKKDDICSISKAVAKAVAYEN
jgi:hypothetical protein